MIINNDAKLTIRYDTTENWSLFNPILVKAEIGVEVNSDTFKLKVGDGVTKWDKLPYLENSLKYFPKNGGELTGNLYFNNGIDSVIYKNINNGRMIIRGNKPEFTGGASLYLHGKDHTNAGCFDIYAHNGTTSKQLRGSIDGDLTWNGVKIPNINTLSMPKTSGRINLENSLTTYTAPCDGYLYATIAGTSGQIHAGLCNTSVGNLYSYFNGSLNEVDTYIPLAKNQIAQVFCYTGNITRLTFYPSQNSN